jgi:hypothetical protein
MWQPDTKRHMQAMFTAWQIRENLRRMYWPKAASIRPHDVIRILRKARIGFVVVGTYGINGYRDQATATQDVDVLLRRKDLKRATIALGNRYRRLSVVSQDRGVWFIDRTNKPVIDLLVPITSSMKAVFENSVCIGQSHRIPNLEMALAGKFAGFSLEQCDAAKRLNDAGDFANIVEANYGLIRRGKLRSLAAKVCRGGGKKILDFVDRIKSGCPISV